MNRHEQPNNGIVGGDIWFSKVEFIVTVFGEDFIMKQIFDYVFNQSKYAAAYHFIML